MSFPRYSAYKATGVEWLDKVPSHWDIVPLWTLFFRTKRTGYADEELLSVYRDYGVIPKSSRVDNFNKPSEDLSTYQLVEPGDLAINKMKAWQGSVAISEYRGIVSPAYHIYLATHQEEPRYLHHLFRCAEYIVGYLANSKGIRVNQWDLEPQQHSRMPVLVPPRHEQIQIARFLDHETARIDTLIEQQQHLIELLKEKRQAVISHAVTKGLNPSVPTKDSGVEWLGQIPKHWKVSKLGHYSQILTGFPFPSEYFSHDESDVRLLRGANIGVGTLRWFDTVYWRLSEIDNLTSYLMEEGQIVLGMDRPWISEGVRIARITREDIPCLLLQRVAAITPKATLDDMFLFYLLASELFRIYVEPDLTGVSVPHISPGQIKSFQIPLPEIEEQRRIGGYVSKQLDRMTALFKQATESIELLQERRSALISAAVTGKIDVRNWQPSTSHAEQKMQKELAHG